MFFSGPSRNWRTNLQQAKVATQQGRLDKAVQIVRRDQLHRYKSGQKLISTLVDQLLRRASESTVAGKIATAWNDLTAADEICLHNDRDRISQQMNGLVDLTVHQAETLLRTGRPAKSVRLLNELWRRRIADRRADNIAKVSNVVVQAEKLADMGDFHRASRQLRFAKSLRPDLGYLDQRIADCENNKMQTRHLTRQLKHDLLDSRYNDAKDVSGRLLKIAPGYQVAIDALKRCFGRSQKSKKPPVQQVVAQPAISDQPQNRSVSGRRRMENQDRKNINLENDPSRNSAVQSFLLWIDGTGGFLVCDGPSVVVGQAIEQARVEIPIQGDLNRRHMRFHQTEQGHQLEPWGDVVVNHKRIEETTAIKDRAAINLGAGILMNYRRPHPLSSTARIELASRHRTQPWSDAIILMADMIVIGPKQTSHIRCPDLTEDIILFRSGDQLMCRYNGHDMEIDGKSCRGRQPITIQSRISGEDFSIMLEPT